MAITVEAVYEDGVLKPIKPLPLREHERVHITVRPPFPVRPPITAEEAREAVERAYGMMDWEGIQEEFERLVQETETPEELPSAPPSGDGLRPYGLCAGKFTVPDDFDQPLPEEILRDFEGR